MKIEEEEIEQIDIIARIYKDGVVKILAKFDNLVEALQHIPFLPFNSNIEEMIRQNKVVVGCNASVKDGIMGGCWKLMIRDQ